MKTIIPVWKPVGASTHIISKQISEKIDVKTAHTGTLDPLAEGVIIILAGEERHNKYELAKWKKTYEFELVFGIQTDSYDALGMITLIESDLKKISKKRLVETLKTFKGRYKQTVPPYSAIKIRGKPLHWYARNNKLSEVKLPTREGKIYKINLLSLKSAPQEVLQKNIVSRIQKTNGDLRQNEIIKRWKQILSSGTPKKFQIAKIKVETSKGLYVRSLSQDIAKKLSTTGFIYSLIRTKNGKYSKQDCETIKSLDLRPLGDN